MKKLAEFPSVLFLTRDLRCVGPPEQKTKFILATISSGQDKKLIFCSVEKWNYHQNVLNTLREKIKEAELTVIVSPAGGGMIISNTTSKRIVIGDYSRSFGNFDADIACKLLREALPDWKIQAIVGTLKK